MTRLSLPWLYLLALAALFALPGCPEEADDDDTVSPDQDGDGWTVEGGDCDDTDPEVYPGAQELFGNGVDDDCDGLVDADYDQGTLVEQLVAIHGDGLDPHLAGPRSGDFDGDGMADLFCDGHDAVDPLEPSAYWFGGRAIWPRELDHTTADGSLTGDAGTGEVDCTSVGDVDDDGYDDLFCEIGDDQCLFPGGAAPWPAGTTTQSPAACIQPDPLDGLTLHSVRRMRDLNGDGIADIALGYGNRATVDGGSFRRAIDVHIFYGRATWTDTLVTASDASISVGHADRMMTRLQVTDEDGDGYVDLLVCMGSPVAGVLTETHLLYGDVGRWQPGMILASSEAVFEGVRDDGSGFFEAVRVAGDLDGDGVNDLHLEALEDGDRFRLGTGSRWSGVVAMDSWDFELTYTDFHEPLGYPHFLDFNGDGLRDVVQGLASPLNFDGEAHVFLGRPGLSGTALWTTASIRLNGPGQVPYGGGFAYPATDLTGDGVGEIIVGSTVQWDGDTRWWYLAPGFTGADPGATDDDGDGFTERDGDCDDTDAAVYPGAAEGLDLTDTNCDGVIADPGVASMTLAGDVTFSGGAFTGSLVLTYLDANGADLCTHDLGASGTTLSDDYSAYCPDCTEQWDMALTDLGHSCAFDAGALAALDWFGVALGQLWASDVAPYGYCIADDCGSHDLDAELDAWIAGGDPAAWLWGPDLFEVGHPEFVGFLDATPGGFDGLPADGDYELVLAWTFDWPFEIR